VGAEGAVVPLLGGVCALHHLAMLESPGVCARLLAEQVREAAFFLGVEADLKEGSRLQGL
jgi:hypothetical protein